MPQRNLGRQRTCPGSFYEDSLFRAEETTGLGVEQRRGPGQASSASSASSCLVSLTSCPQTQERCWLPLLSLSTRRQGGKPERSERPCRGPGPPPAPAPVTSEAQHVLCGVACLYFRCLWNCRVPVFTVLSHDSPQPSPKPCAPLAEDAGFSVSAAGARGSLAARSLAWAGLSVKRQ